MGTLEDYVAAMEVFDMRPIILHCREQQQRQGKPDADVVLRIGGKPWGRRTSCELPPLGPRGRIVGDDFREDGTVRGVIAMFKADKVLAHLAKHGININWTPEDTDGHA